VVPRTRGLPGRPSVPLVKPPPSDAAVPTGTYLVERYLTAAAAEALPDAVARVAGACAGAGHVRYLHSTYLPSEETCFCVFQAASADAVRAVNAEADFVVDRITDARVMFDAPPIARTPKPDQRGDTP
jgi:hypothetical protein